MLKAKGRHGTHSPFVYNLAEQIIPKARNAQPITAIEVQLKKLKKNPTLIEVIDFKTGNVDTKSVAKQASQSTSSLKFRSLLKLLCEELEVKNVLEAGTSFGISAAYLSKAHSVISIDTIEGNQSISDIAKSHFGTFDKIKFHVGDVHHLYPNLIKKIKPQLVFLDADHRGNTIDFYLEALKPVMETVKAIIIHDIYWSKDMYSTWKRHSKKFPIAADIFQAGLLFPNIETPNQQFRLKF